MAYDSLVFYHTILSNYSPISHAHLPTHIHLIFQDVAIVLDYAILWNCYNRYNQPKGSQIFMCQVC